jgi:hypothetical protein
MRSLFLLPNIHLIGDSHCLCFDGAKDVVPHWCGAATAYNLYKKYDLTKTFFEAIEDDYWFCFGEIDCRLHIYRQAKLLNTTELDILGRTVDTYMEAVSVFDGWNIGVMAVPPQGYEDNIYGYDYYASRAHRQQITDVFNFWLENVCIDYGIPFIDIWKQDEIWAEENFKDDKCHIKNEIAIKYLKQYLEVI